MCVNHVLTVKNNGFEENICEINGFGYNNSGWVYFYPQYIVIVPHETNNVPNVIPR
jgi:hypothetical protein